MGEHLIEERYDNHHGINLKSSDLNRDKKYSSGMKNAQYNEKGEVEKRPGFQGHAKSAGGYGLFHYNRVDPVTEIETPEVLTVDSNLHKMNDVRFLIHYAGASATCILTIFFDPITSQYRTQIQEGIVIVLDFPMGVGFEISPVTLAQLKTAIDAVTGFSATITGLNTVPAAFLEIVKSWDLIQSDFNGIARHFTQVNSTVSNPFSTYLSHKNDEDFENVSAVELSNVIYFANGYNEIHKYDGQTFYRAGLPTPASLASSLAAGAVTGSNYVHKSQYIQHDAAGLIVEGNLKTVSTPLNAAGNSMDVVVSDILTGTGFNTDCAIVDTAQVAVNTIKVDDGAAGSHTMKVGDTAYFYDAVSASYVERKVTIVPDVHHITIAGAAVTVADNAVISNNLRIAIYRNKDSATTPTVFYLVVELPNNSFAATQTYNDNLADSALGALFVPPVSDRSLPPKGKYISAFQNQLVIAGNLALQRRIYWSDVDGSEYFPADTNQEDVQTISGDVLSGIGPGGTVFGIFTGTSTHVLSGTLGDNNIRIEEKSADVGCVAHASILQMGGVIGWWSNRGPYYMANGQIPRPIGMDEKGGGRLEPVMNETGLSANELVITKRITAFNWIDQQKALWFLPSENLVSTFNLPNSNSRVYAYDYTRDAWLQWSNLNFMSGAVQYLDEMFFQGREYSTVSSSVVSPMFRMHNLGDSFDYEDNNIPIDWDYGTAWESFGKPSVLKRFLEVKIFSLDQVVNNNFSLLVKQEINYQRDFSSAEFQMSISGGGYGVVAYGTEPYGDIREGSARHELKRSRVKSTRLRYTNNEHQENCVITGWDFLAVLPYRPDFKK